VTSRLAGTLFAHMDVTFDDRDLDRLERDPSYDVGQPRGVVSAFRKRLQGLRCAADARDLLALASWQVAAIGGSDLNCLSVPLTSSARLVVQVAEAAGAEHVRIVRIERVA
jgi:proteic killer suppression protein